MRSSEGRRSIRAVTRTSFKSLVRGEADHGGGQAAREIVDERPWSPAEMSEPGRRRAAGHSKMVDHGVVPRTYLMPHQRRVSDGPGRIDPDATLDTTRRGELWEAITGFDGENLGERR